MVLLLLKKSLVVLQAALQMLLVLNNTRSNQTKLAKPRISKLPFSSDQYRSQDACLFVCLFFCLFVWNPWNETEPLGF